MKLVTPYTGVVIDVPEATKEIYLKRGYTELKAEKPAKKAEAPKEEVEEQPEEQEAEEAPKPKAKKK